MKKWLLVLAALAVVVLPALSAVAADTRPLEDQALLGTHPLALQWLDNDNRGNRGTIRIFRQDGQLLAEGKQEEYYQGERNWMTVSGRIKLLNERELELDGQIRTRISYINGGTPHERNGVFRFKAWGKRPYWRMQNDRTQPDNGFEVTDYIDIYLKKR